MGNNQSLSSSLLEFSNVSYLNSGSSLNSSLPASDMENSSTGFIQDNSEEFLAQLMHQIMAKDEVLAIIRRHIREPFRKKAKKGRITKHRCTAAGNGKRKFKIGVDFKVLTCLRILGRNFVCDSVVEILNTGVITVNNLFKDFVANYSAAYYDKYVYVPVGAELDKVEKVYRYMGFPGCVGSMDVTHLHWGACPKHLRHHCIRRYTSRHIEVI